MLKIHIDGKAVEVPEGTTILNAADLAGVPIPHFCYHPAFIPEGNCRLCQVEIEGGSKLELACATVVREGMKVATQTPQVREARRSVLEFLLSEHPLDCPICDKAGECELQDYYWDYGLTESVFREFKEKREKRARIGEKLILDRERCILCGRCVRFLADVTKTHELGVFWRGIRAEISNYEGERIRNNYSGNLVDLCPVGAITDTEFRFKTRPWFLVKSESVCPMCSRGCNITIDTHPGFPRVPGSAKVVRIRPRVNASVNGHWICDFGRYGFVDGQQKNRCRRPLWSKGVQKTEMSWEKSLTLISEKIRILRDRGKTDRITLILTSWLTNEDLFLAQRIFKNDLGVGRIFFADPKPETGDGFLLQEERMPNRRGAREMGFVPEPVSAEALARDMDLLFIFGPYLSEANDILALKPFLDRITTKILVTSHLNGLERLADFVLPSALPAEKSGSFTNGDGTVQKISAIACVDGDIRPEWEILLALARELKLDDGFYGHLTDTDAIFRELRKAYPRFGMRT